MYFRIEEAEELKKMYSSWIGKRAHIGKGRTDTLKAIVIKPKSDSLPQKNKELYMIEFEFQNRVKFSARQFLSHNSLMQVRKGDGNSGRAA
jgi:hypothetical protein